MAMLPMPFEDSLFDDPFDDWFDEPFFTRMRQAVLGQSPESAKKDGSKLVPASVKSTNLMRTDVRENKDSYDVAIDMPGFKKDDISVELNDGYLTVSAHKDESHSDEGPAEGSKDDKEGEGKWIRRERYVGTCSRSFYVGDQVTDADIHANYKDGTLSLAIAKKEAQPEVEKKHTIAIED